MDRGAWWATVHEVTKSQAITEQLRERVRVHTHTHGSSAWSKLRLHSSLQEEENEIKSKAAVYLGSSEEGASISLPTLATQSYKGNWDL